MLTNYSPDYDSACEQAMMSIPSQYDWTAREYPNRESFTATFRDRSGLLLVSIDKLLITPEDISDLGPDERSGFTFDEGFCEAYYITYWFRDKKVE